MGIIYGNFLPLELFIINTVSYYRLAAKTGLVAADEALKRLGAKQESLKKEKEDNKK